MIRDSVPVEVKVLKKITPTKKDKKEIELIIKSLKESVNKEIKKTDIPITIQLVGSIAKDTYIRTSVDIDLFLLFPATVQRKTLEEKGLTIGLQSSINKKNASQSTPMSGECSKVLKPNLSLAIK
jgi:tRNA nucleotidyltransferase (CCA-adding enzyme)